MKVINDLLNYGGLKIVQNTDYFNFSLDSVLLPNFVTINATTKRILDIGSGNAPIPLILSTKTDSKIDAVEIQKELYELAKESLEINNIDTQINLINGDINEVYQNLEYGKYDLITCNPPYFKYISNSKVNKNEFKTIARHEKTLNLDQLFHIAKVLLRNNGNIGIVHRPERLVEILEKMKKNNIEPKKIRFVYPSIDKPANIVLVEGTKNGKPGLKMLSPLYSHLNNGEYTNEIKKYFEK